MSFVRNQGFMVKIKAYLSNFLQTQLIVTIAAVPILVNWGLSLSLMTFAGNLLFSPILTIFLILSSLVFFTQLLHIPNYFLIVTLDWFTQTWDNILAHGSQDWLIEFCRPPVFFLFAIPIVTVVILHVGKFKKSGTRIGIMTAILGVSLLGLWAIARFDQPSPTANTQATIRLTPKGELPAQTENKELIATETTAKTPKKKITNQLLDIHQEADGRLSITDNGFFNRRKSPEKAVEFELKPYLVKRFGKIHLKEYIIARPGQRTLATAKAFCTLFTVDKVTLPYFEKPLSKGGWREFFGLKRLLEEKKIAFNRRK